MNRSFFIYLTVFLFMMTGKFFPASNNTNRAYSISVTVGIVKYSENNGSNWMKAFPELELMEKSLVKTGINSYCDILMPERGVFRVMDNTTIQIKELKKQVEQIKIRKGNAIFNIAKSLEPGESFTVETSVANAAVRGTKFEIDSDDSNINVSVSSGKVSIKRNVNIPEEYQNDEEVQKLLTVEAESNQTITLTMDENRELEKTINRVKNDKDEVLSVLRNSHEATLKKLKIMKRNIKRVFDELEKYSDASQDDQNQSDDTENALEKVKQH